MHLFLRVALLSTVFLAALASNDTVIVRPIKFDNVTQELVGVDFHKMSLLYLLRYRNSTNTQITLSIVKEQITLNQDATVEKCNVTLEAEPGMKILNQHVILKPFSPNRALLQWMEVSKNQSSRGPEEALLRYYGVRMPNCYIYDTEISVDADESYYRSVISGSNIFWANGGEYSIIFPNKELCANKWCMTSLDSELDQDKVEILPFDYDPSKILTGGSILHPERYWIKKDANLTELWLSNEMLNELRLIRTSKSNETQKQVTYALDSFHCIWCEHDSRQSNKSECQLYTTVLKGIRGLDYKIIDHGEKIIWINPVDTVADGLILVSLRHSNKEGKCNIVATKQSSYETVALRSEVMHQHVDCETFSRVETALDKLRFSPTDGAYCFGLVNSENAFSYVIKCFKDARVEES